MTFLLENDKWLLLEEQQTLDIAGLISFQKPVSSASSVPGSELSTHKIDKQVLAHCLTRHRNPAVAKAGCALNTDRSSRRLENRE